MRVALLAGVAAIALSGQPARAEDGKWQGHGEIAVRPGSDRTSGQLELFVPLWQDDTSLIFGDLRGLGDTDNEIEGSGGLGYRTLMGDGWILGGYLFGDARHTDHGNTFWQGSAGLEALSWEWDVRVNGYVPEDDRKRTGSPELIWLDELRPRGRTPFEAALWGADGEVGMLLPGVLEETRAYVGGFYFDSQYVDREWGPKARLETRLSDMSWLGAGSRLTLGVEGEYDVENDDPEGRGLIRLRVPFGAPDAGMPLTPLQRRMTETVVRDMDIRVRRADLVERLGVREPKTDRGFDEVLYVTANAAGTGSKADPTDFANGTADGVFGPDDLLMVDGSNGTIPTNFRMDNGQYIVGDGGVPLYGIQTGHYFTSIESYGTRPTLKDASNGMRPVIVGANDTQIQGVEIVGGHDGIVYRNADDFMVLDTVIRDVRANHLAQAYGTDDGMVIDHSSNGMIMNVAIFNLMGPDADGFDIDDSHDILLQDVRVDGVWSTASASVSATANDGLPAFDNSIVTQSDTNVTANASLANAEQVTQTAANAVTAVADGDGIDIDHSTNITIAGAWISNIHSEATGSADVDLNVWGERATLSQANATANGGSSVSATALADRDVALALSQNVDVTVQAIADGDAVDIDDSREIVISDLHVRDVSSEAEVDGTLTLRQTASVVGSGRANAMAVAGAASTDVTANAQAGANLALDLGANAGWHLAAVADGDAVDLDNGSSVKVHGAWASNITSVTRLTSAVDVGLDMLAEANALAEAFLQANAVQACDAAASANATASVTGQAVIDLDVGVNLDLGLTSLADGDGFDIDGSNFVKASEVGVYGINSNADLWSDVDVAVDLRGFTQSNTESLALTNASSGGDLQVNTMLTLASVANTSIELDLDSAYMVKSIADGDGIDVADSGAVLLHDGFVHDVWSQASAHHATAIDVSASANALQAENSNALTYVVTGNHVILNAVKVRDAELTADISLDVALGGKTLALAGGDGVSLRSVIGAAVLDFAVEDVWSSANASDIATVEANVDASASGLADDTQIIIANGPVGNVSAFQLGIQNGAEDADVGLWLDRHVVAIADGDGYRVAGGAGVLLRDVSAGNIWSGNVHTTGLETATINATTRQTLSSSQLLAVIDQTENGSVRSTQIGIQFGEQDIDVAAHSTLKVLGLADGDGFSLSGIGLVVLDAEASNIWSGDVNATALGSWSVNSDFADTVAVETMVKAKGLADGDGFDLDKVGVGAVPTNAITGLVSDGVGVLQHKLGLPEVGLDLRFGGLPLHNLGMGELWALMDGMANEMGLGPLLPPGLANGDLSGTGALLVDIEARDISSVNATAIAGAEFEFAKGSADTTALAKATVDGDGVDIDHSRFVAIGHANVWDVSSGAAAAAASDNAMADALADGDGFDINDSMNVVTIGYSVLDIQDDGIDVDPSQNIVFDHGLIMSVGGHGVEVGDNGTDNVFIFNTTIDGTDGDGINVMAPLDYDAVMPFDFGNAEVFIHNVTFNDIGGVDIAGSNIDNP